jgi:hypothetical protein
MHDVYWMCGAIFLVLLTMRFRGPILAALKRFDDENVRRIARQADEGRDPSAHIRHALEVADEQVEPVQEVKVGTQTQYLFEAELFASRDAAEEMRARRVGVIARRFYEELPSALMGAPERTRMSARERSSARWKRTVH